MKNPFLFLAFIFPVFLFSLSCHSPTGPSQPELAITAEWVGVTDAALRLHIAYTLFNDRFKLQEDTAVIASGRIPLTDTVIYVDNLLPLRSYSYYLAKFDSSGKVEGGTTLTFTTMDTTSNNFSWQFDTLAGQSGSSYLNDVMILDDTTAYAVGGLYLADTVVGEQTQNERNFAVWNGKQWNLQLVRYLYPNGIFGEEPLYSIFVFARNDIWVGGTEAYHWDGSYWNQTGITNANFGVGRIFRFWGRSSSDLYAVGGNGSMAHYDGSQWTQLQSGTTLDIQDIWGATDSKSGQQTILAAAGNVYVSIARQVLQINGMQVTTVPYNGITGALRGIWFLPGEQYWAVGDGVFENRLPLNAPEWDTKFVTTYFSEAIRGDGLNNIFVCGDFGDLWHYNGVSWHSFRPEASNNGAYYSVAVKGNLVITVGELNPPAVIAVGRRR